MKKSATSAPFVTAIARATTTPQPPGMCRRESPKVRRVNASSATHTIAYRATCEPCSTCSCGSRATAPGSAMERLLDEVDEREDEDPDEIDEVPVQPRE